MKKISRINKYRNSRIKEYLKVILNSLIMFLKTFFELLVYLIRNLIKFIYKIFYKLNSLIGKLFMKLPRIFRVAIIYSMLLTTIFDFTGIIQDKKIISFYKVEYKQLSNISMPPEGTPKCKFDDISCKIYNKGLELELSEEEILISIAISKWETGNYTSYAFKSLNNVGGMMCKDGLITYSSLNEGIEAFLTNLKKNYFEIGLNTLEKIQPKYCPIGAANDPNNLNQYWLSGTKKKLEELK